MNVTGVHLTVHKLHPPPHNNQLIEKNKNKRIKENSYNITLKDTITSKVVFMFL